MRGFLTLSVFLSFGSLALGQASGSVEMSLFTESSDLCPYFTAKVFWHVTKDGTIKVQAPMIRPRECVEKKHALEQLRFDRLENGAAAVRKATKQFLLFLDDMTVSEMRRTSDFEDPNPNRTATYKELSIPFSVWCAKKGKVAFHISDISNFQVSPSLRQNPSIGSGTICIRVGESKGKPWVRTSLYFGPAVNDVTWKEGKQSGCSMTSSVNNFTITLEQDHKMTSPVKKIADD